MQARDFALSHARSRMAFGAALIVAPGTSARLWIGDDARRPGVKVIARALGIRDIALGLGIAIALDRGAPVRGWFEAAALSDSVDFVATLLARGSIPDGGRRAVAAIAGSAALTCIALARALDEL